MSNAMRLPVFIREHSAQIILDWENFAESLTPISNDMGSLALRDHIKGLLVFIADDIESAQTGVEQMSKSRGEKARNSVPTAAESHAGVRLAAGFDMDQMVSEYRALRASIVKLWSRGISSFTNQDLMDLIRFNESIDQELSESIRHYTEKVTHSKDMFLGILSHDLRTPINASVMSAQLLPVIGTLNERQTMLATQIVECSTRATEIISNLFDLTRARFGSGLPVLRDEMNMGFVSRQLVDEMRAVHPTASIKLQTSGALDGAWDKARIGQVFSNLIGNAIQYGFSGLPITVTVDGTGSDVVLSVHNDGVPIPPHTIRRIFDSMTRGGDEKLDENTSSVHLGLGLYITKEIVTSHGGTIDVTSNEQHGTTFTSRFPRVVA